MSFEFINHVRDHSKATGPARLVLIMIATRTDDEGYAFPGYPVLAKDTGMTIRSVRRALKEIPPGEIVITPGGSPKGQKRVPTLFKIVINKTNPAPIAHSQGKSDTHDPAHIGTRPCAVGPTTLRVQVPDPAQYAHLTVLNSLREQKENRLARAHTREGSSPNGSGPVASSQKPFAVARNEEEEEPKPTQLTPKKEKRHKSNNVVRPRDFPKFQKRYKFVTVSEQFEPAKAECAKRHPNRGPMGARFFCAWLEIANERAFKGNADRLIAAESKFKAKILAEADRNRRELTPKKEEEAAEHKRTRFITDLHQHFPQINAPDIAECYAQECESTGVVWNDKEFKRRVGEAQASYEKEWRESRK